MTETGSLRIGPGEERQLKAAVESTCEVCGTYTPISFLEVHLISRRRIGAEKRDPSLRLLIVCPDCHRKLHTLPVPKKIQRAVAAGRNFYIRRDLRKVLGYQPAPYRPPEDQDLGEIYEDYRNFPQRLSG